ncbi:MAG: hypothetical protein MUE85_03495 [Microscillaceae bacterium]|jgi:hypothetical protein|nr:hypothetical protein [Microscillaceae bacterium]
MENWTLEKIDFEDLNDLIAQIETAFAIQFAENELSSKMSVAELCEKVLPKIKAEAVNDCTTQQAFYKLRQILRSVSGHQVIKPQTKLKTIFPKGKLRNSIQKIEKELQIENLFWVAPTLAGLGLGIGVVGLFFSLILHWTNGMYLFLSIFFISIISMQTFKVFRFQTVGELSQYLTNFHYFQARRNAYTYNPHEVKKIIKEWFEVYYK